MPFSVYSGITRVPFGYSFLRTPTTMPSPLTTLIFRSALDVALLFTTLFSGLGVVLVLIASPSLVVSSGAVLLSIGVSSSATSPVISTSAILGLSSTFFV